MLGSSTKHGTFICVNLLVFSNEHFHIYVINFVLNILHVYIVSLAVFHLVILGSGRKSLNCCSPW